MKNIITLLLTLQLGLLAGLAQIGVDPIVVWPLAYQGTLSSNGVAVNAPHDVILSLWAGPVGGTQIGASITNETVDVNNGQFRITMEGRDGWSTSDLSATNLHVEVALRRSGSGQPYVTLSPRQRMAHLPLAAVAERARTISPAALNVDSLGTNAVDGAILKLASLTADKIATGQVVKSLNGLKDGVNLATGSGLTLTTSIDTITVSALPPPPFLCSDYYHCYWNLLGNNNITPGVTFLGGVAGELDPLEFRVNNTHAQRFEWSGNGTAGAIPNRIGGAQANSISTSQGGSSIVGGGSSTQPNRILDGSWSFIGGGNNNIITNHYSAIVGGWANRIGRGPAGSPHPFGFIGGGEGNKVFGYTAEIGGGRWNFVDASASYGGIWGGLTNYVGGTFGFIGNGKTNRIMISADFGAIGGGEQNLISNSSDWATIGGGLRNTVTNSLTTIAGGGDNSVRSTAGSIGGGERNSVFALSDGATIGGGSDNTATNLWATAGGGRFNSVSGFASTIAGGERNAAEANHSAVGGGLANRAVGVNATVGGGAGNIAGIFGPAISPYQTVSGGVENQALPYASTVGGGQQNIVKTGAHGTIGGGTGNLVEADKATIPGGQGAWANKYGQQAYASGQFASPGDAQTSLFVLRRENSAGGTVNLLLDGSTPTALINVPAGKTMTFEILATARQKNTDSSAGYCIKGVVKRVGPTAFLVAPVTVLMTTEDAIIAPFWAFNVVAVGADLVLQGTDNSTAANPVRWVARVETAEVAW